MGDEIKHPYAGSDVDVIDTRTITVLSESMESGVRPLSGFFDDFAGVVEDLPRQSGRCSAAIAVVVAGEDDGQVLGDVSHPLKKVFRHTENSTFVRRENLV